MEKKNKLTDLIRFTKIVIVATYCLFFFGLIFLQLWAMNTGSSFSGSSLIYWTILVGWLMLDWNYRWRSSSLMAQALVFFIVGVLLSAINLRVVAEIAMRTSFIGWIMGMAQALIEYGKGNIKK